MSSMRNCLGLSEMVQHYSSQRTLDATCYTTFALITPGHQHVIVDKIHQQT